MDDLNGRWTGQVRGTNTGNFVVDVDQKDNNISGTLRMNDAKYGISVFTCTGEISGDQVELLLLPQEARPGVEIKPSKVIGKIKSDGSWVGDWESELGTAGNFVAYRSKQLLGTTAATAADAAATAMIYEKGTRIKSCTIDNDTLRRIYQDLTIGADEAARLEIAKMPKDSLPEDIKDDPQSLSIWAKNLYSITVFAKGTNGEQIVTIDPQILNQDLLPKPLESIEFNIGYYYHWSSGNNAPNNIRVILDFRKTSLLDISKVSGHPTPNESKIIVNGNDSIWVSGIYEKLSSILLQGKVGTGWIHTSHIYDVLVWTLGFPMSFLIAAYFSETFISKTKLSMFYGIGVFIFVSLTALLAFRLSFSFVRWLLPYVEYSKISAPIHRQIRVFIAAFTLGVICSLAAAAIYAAF